MAVKLSPVFNDAQLDSSGNPYVGAQLFTYAAGSTTKQTAYQDSAGLTQHTNPIVLNSRGEPPAPIWLTEGSTYKLYLTTPTDTDPPVTSVRVIDNIRGVNDATVTIDEWISSGLTPTYVSATSFTLSGDQTTEFHEGRRLKITDSGGSKYVTITGSTYAPSTTTVVVAGDALASPTSAVSYSIIRATNSSISSEMLYKKGAAVASAATCDIWNTQGDYIHIQGSTGITSFGTAPYAGMRKTLIFDSALTISHSSTLKTPGAQDLTVAANFMCEVVADTTTSHRISETAPAFSRPAQFGRMSISGLTYANNSGDATNDLDIAVGACRDSTDAMDMVLASAITKQSDVAWAVGSGNGGLDTGATGNSDYYIWLIKRSDTGVVDALYSLSSTAPTMPTNYDYKRLIGWFKRVGGTIVAFHTYETEGGGIEVSWDVPTLDVNLANTLTTARRTDAVKVPLNFSTIAHLNIMAFDAAANFMAWFYNPDQTDAAPATGAAPLFNFAQNGVGRQLAYQYRIRTSSTGTIAARAEIATVDQYSVSTMGFHWARRNS
jgi:hypothetical protein